ncbi:MAG TPA: PEP/pyruvate-binding domain-containing protein, partial [Bacteroidia bacterium]
MNCTLPLKKVNLDDINLVGGKNASLGEMLQNLSALGIKIPNGFVVTVNAYYEFIRYNDLEKNIHGLMQNLDPENIESLRRTGMQVRQLILNGRFPKELSAEIILAYEGLSKEYGQEGTDVAVRSSATAEDLPDASFAGQQETFLNVRGPASLMDAIRKCFASLFTDRAISYRHNFNYD